MKIVINKCFGGFGLSHEATMRYAEIKGIRLYSVPDKWITNYYTDPEHKEFFSEYDIKRDDPALVQVVHELGESANGKHALLRVIEIPDGTEYDISDYDGIEHIAERHQTWG